MAQRKGCRFDHVILPMKVRGVSSVNETIAKFVFLILPTACVGYFLLWNANSYFSILQNQAVEQSLYWFAGMTLSLLFYAFRFRFLTTFAILLLVIIVIYKGLDATAVGEFDTFFLSVRFLVFSTLFSTGWLIGAAFARWRYAHYFIAAGMLIASVLLIAKQKTESTEQLFAAFLPAMAYAFYIIFAAEQIYNYKDKSQRFWWFMSRRIVLFLLLIGLVGGIVSHQMKKRFDAAVAEAGGKGEKGDDNGLLKKNKDGKFDLKNYAQLRNKQGRGNELLFAAHIDNFFPGTDIPNPLYLTAYYYTKFDTATETFERDAKIPKNDLFLPDPSKIPMYATRKDSTVIKNGMGDKLRRVVEVEIYNKQLTASTYLAPSIGFFVQPIAIEKDFRGQFASAFRAKGYVSELNSAYFIYNAKDPQIKLFQEQRFEVLRRAESYDKVDTKFMAYYTQMPKDEKFQRISALAAKVAANAKTPVDKVLAIRDYFLSKDEEGNPLFSYTDNPGVPDIPSASKLMYFLFDNHKGYCAYYAGATLFMLRSLGVPSRIAAGFLTIDRSDKNKGWYWYYADQAHAWVQVYIPGYGWLDFDTTVGDDDAQQSPSPDGTPPMQPPHAWFASEGQIVGIDLQKRTIKLKTADFLFHDKEYKLENTAREIVLDVSIANIQKDSVNIDLSKVRVGDSATAVSYAEVLKKMEASGDDESPFALLERMPKLIPIDDVYLKKTPEQIKEEQLKNAIAASTFSWKLFFIRCGIVSGILLLLFLLIPVLILAYYKWRAKTATVPEKQIYWQYRGLGFFLHQLGYFRGNVTPLFYAQHVVDVHFKTNFSSFMNTYLKVKYTGKALSQEEYGKIKYFMPQAMQQIKTKIPTKSRLSAFLRPLRAFTFYINQSTNQ